MWRLATVLLAACSTTTHTGPFVTDIRSVGTALEVASCDVNYTVTHAYNQYESFGANDCQYERIEMRPVDGLLVLAPDGCAPAVTAWERVADAPLAERRALWNQLPVHCRAFLDEALR